MRKLAGQLLLAMVHVAVVVQCFDVVWMCWAGSSGARSGNMRVKRVSQRQYGRWAGIAV